MTSEYFRIILIAPDTRLAHDTTFGALKDTMVSRSPHVTPACRFERLDYLANSSEPQFRCFRVLLSASCRLPPAISAFKVPRRILFVDRIPKGATGKARRIALREELNVIWEWDSLAGASGLELQLVEIWNRILQNEVGLDDDFFAAGGDSLAATVMLAEVRSALAVDPSLLDRMDFFENPTIRSLARIVTECGNTGEKPESALIALQPNGSRRPLFLMPDASSEPYYFRSLAKHLGKRQPVLALRYASDRAAGSRTVESVAANCGAVIRSLRSRGPYLLAGHCFGGIVAFEIARQLIASGEQVELLALLDATTPGYPKAPEHWRRYARALRSVLARSAGRKITVRDAIAHIRYLVARARLLGAARWRRRLAVSPLATVLPQLDAAGIANDTAGRNYVPRPAPVRVLQFIAAGQPIDTRILDDPGSNGADLRWMALSRIRHQAAITPCCLNPMCRIWPLNFSTRSRAARLSVTRRSLSKLMDSAVNVSTIHILERTPQMLRELIANATPEDLDWQPRLDRWSISMVLAHLAEVEVKGFMSRFHDIVQQDHPFLPAYDQLALSRPEQVRRPRRIGSIRSPTHRSIGLAKNRASRRSSTHGTSRATRCRQLRSTPQRVCIS